MKKLFLLFAFLLLSSPAFAQYTRLGATQIIYGQNNLPDTTAYLTVFKVVMSGVPITLTPKTYRTDSSGYFLGDDGARGIRFRTGAQVWVYSNITLLPGISRNPSTGTQYTVPANTSTQLEELIYDLTLFGTKGSSLWGLSTGRPSTLSVGTNGYILVADSAETLGVKWALPATVLAGGTPQTLTGAGAVNLTTFSTLIVSTGADATTLAAGAEGQFKFIRMKTDGGDSTLTVTNFQQGTTITFNDVGDSVLLIYQDGKWNLLANNGCAIA